MANTSRALNQVSGLCHILTMALRGQDSYSLHFTKIVYRQLVVLQGAMGKKPPDPSIQPQAYTPRVCWCILLSQ